MYATNKKGAYLRKNTLDCKNEIYTFQKYQNTNIYTNNNQFKSQNIYKPDINWFSVWENLGILN